MRTPFFLSPSIKHLAIAFFRTKGAEARLELGLIENFYCEATNGKTKFIPNPLKKKKVVIEAHCL